MFEANVGIKKSGEVTYLVFSTECAVSDIWGTLKLWVVNAMIRPISTFFILHLGARLFVFSMLQWWFWKVVIKW